MNKYLISFVLIAYHGLSQVVQTARFEIPITNDEAQYQLVPWEKNGAILYRRVESAKTDFLEFIKLDVDLKESWKSSVNVSKQLSLVYSRGLDETVYFLFKPKGYFGDFQLLGINKDSAANVVYTIKNIIPFNPSMFEIGRKNLVIAGYYNYRPVVILFSLKTGETKLLPGFFNDPGELDQLILNKDETIDVVVNIKNSERRRSLWIMNYSAEGAVVKNTIINPPPDKSLIFGSMVKSSGDSIIIAGVYGKNSEYSRGVFVASLNEAGEYTVRYYNFADLKNFFKYMKVGRQSRIQERIERKKVKGKKIRFNYRIAVHEFIPYQNHFLMLGEAFYPVYKSTGYGYSYSRMPLYYGRFYSGSAMQRDYIFDGYRYTHAVTIGIAKDGRLLWDNSFEIRDIKSFTLDQYVHLIPGQNLNLVYSYDNRMYYKVIQGTEVVEGKSEEQMKGLFESDKIKKNSTTSHHLKYWYGDYLLSYGEQELQNMGTLNVAITRKVFFVNKITFRE